MQEVNFKIEDKDDCTSVGIGMEGIETLKHYIDMIMHLEYCLGVFKNNVTSNYTKEEVENAETTPFKKLTE